MKGTVRSLIDSAFSMTCAALLVKIIGALYKIPLSYILDESGLGYFNTAYSVYGFFYIILSSGIPKALTLTISTLNGQNRESAGLLVYKKFLRVISLLSTVLAISVALFSKNISELLGNARAAKSILAIAPAILFVSMGCVARGYLNAYLKLGNIAISQIIEAFLKLIFGITFSQICKNAGGSLESISAVAISGLTLGTSISTIYLLIAAKIQISNIKVRQKEELLSDVDLKLFLNNSIPMMISSVILAVNGLVDVPLILRVLVSTGFSEFEANALYGNFSTLALPMLSLSTSLLSPIAISLLPKVTYLNQQNEKLMLRREYLSSIYMTFLFAIPIALTFWLYSFEILDFLYLDNQAVNGAKHLSILAISVILQPIFNILITMLEGSGRLRSSVLVTGVSLVCKILSGVFLIGIKTINVYGAPISTAISNLVGICIALIILGKEFIISGSILQDILIIASFSFATPFLLIYCSGVGGGGICSALISGAISVAVYTLLVLFNTDLRSLLIAKCTKNALNCYE